MEKSARGKGETKAPVKKDRFSVFKRIFKRIGRYFREVSSELKKVSWPNRKELVNATIAAIVFIVIFAIVVGVVDLILGQLLKLIT